MRRREGDRNSSIAGGAVQCFRRWCTFASVYARRPRAPAGVAVRYRSRAAVVVVGSARASGGACRRPDGTLFFFVVALLQHGGVGVFAPFATRATWHPRTRPSYKIQSYTNVFVFTTLHGQSGSRITFRGINVFDIVDIIICPAKKHSHLEFDGCIVT